MAHNVLTVSSFERIKPRSNLIFILGLVIIESIRSMWREVGAEADDCFKARVINSL